MTNIAQGASKIIRQFNIIRKVFILSLIIFRYFRELIVINRTKIEIKNPGNTPLKYVAVIVTNNAAIEKMREVAVMIFRVFVCIVLVF